MKFSIGKKSVSGVKALHKWFILKRKASAYLFFLAVVYFLHSVFADNSFEVLRSDLYFHLTGLAMFICMAIESLGDDK